MAAISPIKHYQGTTPVKQRELNPLEYPKATSQSTPAADIPKQQPPPSPAIEELASELAENLRQMGQGHQVAIRQEEGTNRPIIEVRDKEGKLLNQFPPEKMLNLRRVLADLSGAVINRMT